MGWNEGENNKQMKCNKCDLELLEISEPCPNCGTLNAGYSAQTHRKVTSEAKATVQTIRNLLGMMDYYKRYPKQFFYTIILVIISGILMTALSFIFSRYTSNIWSTLVPNIAGCFLGILITWRHRPRFIIGPEWETWQNVDRKNLKK